MVDYQRLFLAVPWVWVIWRWIIQLFPHFKRETLFTLRYQSWLSDEIVQGDDRRRAAIEVGGGGRKPGRELIMPGSREGGMTENGLGGAAANLILSISDSWSRLVLALLFWNQILTWVSLNLRLLENSALSDMDKYCFSLYFFSRALSCWVVKGVRGFLLALCFLSTHLRGTEGPGRQASAIENLYYKGWSWSF